MPAPLYVTAEELRKLRALMRRQYRGENGIEVRQSDDVVSVVNVRRDRDDGSRGGGLTLVKVSLASGQAGSLTTPCTFTYDIHRADAATLSASTLIASARTPHRLRTAVGAYEAAPSGSFGYAIYTGNAWVFLEALQERPLTEGCG